MNRKNLALTLIISLLIVISGCSSTAEHAAMNTRQLTICPDKPNCVNSQQQDFHHIEPLLMSIPTVENWNAIVKTVAELPRTTIVTQTDGYLHAEARTRFFHFTDDLELLRAADGKTIDVRSASRLGYSDMGTNRRRIEQLRKIL